MMIKNRIFIFANNIINMIYTADNTADNNNGNIFVRTSVGRLSGGII